MQRLGRYQLLDAIGAGPNGNVTRARVYGVVGFEREFAIKQFFPALLTGPNAAAALSTAARGYGTLEHPRIARMAEYMVTQGQTFAAVEYVAGLDAGRFILDATVTKSPLPPGGLLTVLSQVARAVGYAHGRGLFHLGLCPQNLIFTADGECKVTDFGLLAATLPPKPVNEPRLAQRIGYLAPEQLVGEPTSAATDVFALGAITYEMLTHRRPFVGDSPIEVQQAILSSQPADPSLPRPIVRVLQRALARSAFERFPDARAFADAIDAALRVAPLPGSRKDIGTRVTGALSRQVMVDEGASGMVPLPTAPFNRTEELDLDAPESSSEITSVDHEATDLSTEEFERSGSNIDRLAEELHARAARNAQAFHKPKAAGSSAALPLADNLASGSGNQPVNSAFGTAQVGATAVPNRASNVASGPISSAPAPAGKGYARAPAVVATSPFSEGGLDLGPPGRATPRDTGPKFNVSSNNLAAAGLGPAGALALTAAPVIEPPYSSAAKGSPAPSAASTIRDAVMAQQPLYTMPGIAPPPRSESGKTPSAGSAAPTVFGIPAAGQPPHVNAGPPGIAIPRTISNSSSPANQRADASDAPTIPRTISPNSGPKDPPTIPRTFSPAQGVAIPRTFSPSTSGPSTAGLAGPGNAPLSRTLAPSGAVPAPARPRTPSGPVSQPMAAATAPTMMAIAPTTGSPVSGPALAPTMMALSPPDSAAPQLTAPPLSPPPSGPALAPGLQPTLSASLPAQAGSPSAAMNAAPAPYGAGMGSGSIRLPSANDLPPRPHRQSSIPPIPNQAQPAPAPALPQRDPIPRWLWMLIGFAGAAGLVAGGWALMRYMTADDDAVTSSPVASTSRSAVHKGSNAASSGSSTRPTGSAAGASSAAGSSTAAGSGSGNAIATTRDGGSAVGSAANAGSATSGVGSGSAAAVGSTPVPSAGSSATVANNSAVATTAGAGSGTKTSTNGATAPTVPGQGSSTAGTGVATKPTSDGQLVIQSTPPGAHVYLDGADEGVTPLTVAGSADKHNLALVLPNYELHLAAIEGKGNVSVTLKEITPFGGPAGIKVRCKDQNRYYVYVDGKPSGQLCPTEKIEVDVGNHTVEIYDLQSEARRQFPANVTGTSRSLRVRVD